MSRQRVVAVARILVALITLGAVVYAVATNWTEVSGHLSKISLGTFALAFALACVGTWLTMLAWRIVLADLGSDLHLAPASGVYFVGQLGKYLPGSVWSVLVQADMAAHLKVPRRRTAVAGLVALGLSLLTGGLVGLGSVGFLLRRSDGAAWWLLLAIPVVLVLFIPRLLNLLIAWLLKLLRRPPLEHELSGKAVVLAVVTFVAVWLVFGLHTYVLAAAVAGDSPHPDLWQAAMTGYALAVAIGMLTIILPAGLGAREGLLTLILSAAIPVAAAAAVAIVSRFIVTIVDVLAALLGWAYARTHHLLDKRASAADLDADDLDI